MTIVELLVVMGIFSVLAGVVFVNLIAPLNRSYTASSLETLLADIKAQQVKSMTGSSQGQSHGVYFGNNFYTTFTGSAYNSNDASNITTTLSSGVKVTDSTIPSSTLVFIATTGEIAGFSGTAYQFTLKNTNNNQAKVVTINRYGALEAQ